MFYASQSFANFLTSLSVHFVAGNKNQAKKDFWQDFRRKIGALAIAGLMVLTMLVNPSQTSAKAPQGV
ncbi:hypothetical protein ACFPAG_09175 [Vogesella sp. GCM10023246]|uniref:Uncharacterized protein n=1 Tax=Vogesella oryzagri TaxID=3160864 RepID=A0ABV1M3G9_9NEIS